MQAMNQAAGSLHKNMSNTVRRCHGPHSPIKSDTELGNFCKLFLPVVCVSLFTLEHIVILLMEALSYMYQALSAMHCRSQRLSENEDTEEKIKKNIIRY